MPSFSRSLEQSLHRALALANERLAARPRSVPNRRFRERAEAIVSA